MNIENSLELSIIVPVFNEQDSITILSEHIVSICNENRYSYEIIFVDDGSTDNSGNIIANLNKRNSRIKLIQFRRNYGKSAALSAGFKYAKGKFLITMDGDLQDDPEDISKFIESIHKGYDVISGWKKERHDRFIKRLSSKFFNLVVSRIFKIKLHDLNCGFKIYREEAIKNIEIYGDLYRFLPVILHNRGYKIAEVPVRHHARRYGTSKYGAMGLGRYKNFLLDPISLLAICRYIVRPAHFFGNIGLVFLAIGLAICSYLSLLWLNGEVIGSRPLLFLGILLVIVSVQLFCLGFLAEIIVYVQDRHRDYHYSIKRKLLQQNNSQ